MADYKGMYLKLFNAITDATRILQAAQTEAEEMFLTQTDTNIMILDKPDKNDLTILSAKE